MAALSESGNSGGDKLLMVTQLMPTATGMPFSVCCWTESQQESFWLLPHCCCRFWPLVLVWEAWAELEVVEDCTDFVVEVALPDFVVDCWLRPSRTGLAMVAAANAATARMENCMLIDVGFGWESG